MADLSVKFAGLDFKNPVTIAAHAPSIPQRELFSDEELSKWHMNIWRKYYEGDVGALTTGTIFAEEMPMGRGAHRLCPVSTKGFAEKEGFLGSATTPDICFPRTPGIMAVEKAKKEFTDMRVIAGIMGPGTDPEGWGQLALEAEQAGADAVELNVGSVMLMDTQDQAIRGIMSKRNLPSGVSIGLVPEVVANIVKGIKKKVSIPVIVKITPELGFHGLLGALSIYREAKVDGLTCIHSLMTIAPPDIYNGGKTTYPHFSKTTWWGTVSLGGRWTCYRDVACVAKYAPDIDVEACGGLVTPEHSVEALMLGAKLVQQSSGIFYNGISYPGRVVKFLKKYMDEQGYKSMNEVIGLAQQYIVEMGEMQEEYKSQIGRLIAHVDYDKCVGTDACRICLDTWCAATYEDNGVAKVDPKRCCACYLCVYRCPHGARSLSYIDK